VIIPDSPIISISKRLGITVTELCRAPAGGVRRAILVLDVMPSAGQLATEVHLAGVVGVIVDNQPQVRLLASWAGRRWDGARFPTRWAALSPWKFLVSPRSALRLVSRLLGCVEVNQRPSVLDYHGVLTYSMFITQTPASPVRRRVRHDHFALGLTQCRRYDLNPVSVRHQTYC
jgi:hypothetical protein